MDWVLPTDEILAKVDKTPAYERKGAEPKATGVITDNVETVPVVKAHDDLMSRLIK
jgi:hypothetical protein